MTFHRADAVASAATASPVALGRDTESRLFSVSAFPRVSRSAIRATAAAGLLTAAGLSAGEGLPVDFHVKLTPETAILGHFSATKNPVVVVPSGATVRIGGLGLFAGAVEAKFHDGVEPRIYGLDALDVGGDDFGGGSLFRLDERGGFFGGAEEQVIQIFEAAAAPAAREVRKRRQLRAGGVERACMVVNSQKQGSGGAGAEGTPSGQRHKTRSRREGTAAMLADGRERRRERAKWLCDG